jgi:hypothetical protein
MALGSTQPLTEMSTRCITGGKGGRCIRLTTLPPSCAVVMKSGNLNILEPSGLLRLLYNRYRVFTGGKVRLRRDADPSPPSSAKVKNRVELYLYSP